MQVQNRQIDSDVASGFDTWADNVWLNNPDGGPGELKQLTTHANTQDGNVRNFEHS